MRVNWIFGFVCFLTGVTLTFLVVKPSRALPLRKIVEAKPVARVQIFGATNQPGGLIEALKIPFADATQIFADRPIRLRKTQWFFENFTVPQLVEYLGTCELTVDQGNDLARTSRVEIATNGCLLTPSDFLVRSLSPASRGKIYSALEPCSFNYGQQYPFRFGLDDFESRFECSGLTSKSLQIIHSLTYTNAGELCLADLEELPGVLSAEEFNRAVDALYRFPVYRLRLRVPHGADVEPLVNYWGAGGREQRIRPLISSLSKVPSLEGTSISISGLLPDFAQLRLYTFPSAWKESTIAKEDCFWSSMNFFNEEPDPRFFEASYTRQILESNYHPVQAEPKFGDLLTLVDRNGNGLHMCVYLVDNFVFTKNGVNLLSPWVIMKTSDMLLLFFPSKEVDRKFIIYRRN